MLFVSPLKLTDKYFIDVLSNYPKVLKRARKLNNYAGKSLMRKEWALKIVIEVIAKGRFDLSNSIFE